MVKNFLGGISSEIIAKSFPYYFVAGISSLKFLHLALCEWVGLELMPKLVIN
jgi:hypothetical protein